MYGITKINMVNIYLIYENNKYDKEIIIKIPILFNFGKMPIANSFSKTVSMKGSYDMKIAFNKNYVFQLVNAPNPKKLFTKTSFLSSTSNHMKEHFTKISNKKE